METLDLDQEEKELLESIENDEWVSIDNVEKEIKRLQSYARNQFADRSITVGLVSVTSTQPTESAKIALEDGLSGDDALSAAFEANARDVARIGGS